MRYQIVPEEEREHPLLKHGEVVTHHLTRDGEYVSGSSSLSLKDAIAKAATLEAQHDPEVKRLKALLETAEKDAFGRAAVDYLNEYGT